MSNLIREAMPDLQEALLDSLGESVVVGTTAATMTVSAPDPGEDESGRGRVFKGRLTDLVTVPAIGTIITFGSHTYRVFRADCSQYGWVRLFAVHQ